METYYNKGDIVKATVTSLESYGAFVELRGNYTGLIHISEISDKYVRNIENFIRVGDSIFVEILDVDDDLKQLKLSIKNIRYRIKKHTKMSAEESNTIEETAHGFVTLKANLPIWIEKKLKKIENEKNLS